MLQKMFQFSQIEISE